MLQAGGCRWLPPGPPCSLPVGGGTGFVWQRPCPTSLGVSLGPHGVVDPPSALTTPGVSAAM